MNLDDMKRLISEKKQVNKNCESKVIEWKRSTSKLVSIAETLCAFLNNSGGTVFVGITDDGKIVGQEVSDKTKKEIGNILSKFEPTANIMVEYVDIGQNKKVIVFTAYPDPRCIPYVFNGKPWDRDESQTRLMSQNRYQQLLLSRNLEPHSWEDLFASDMSIEDLDVHEIRQTLKDMSRNKRIDMATQKDDVLDLLKRLKLIKHGKLINAAAILFAKDEPGDYMQCVLRMARFKGTKKTNLIDSRHVFGHAFYLLREAEVFINRNTAIASNLKTGRLVREDHPEYPVQAIREALINAFCHRDYSSAGGSISIFIYDDRLEIANAGLLPSGISLHELKRPHTSHPRNPKILNVFFRRGLIEALGIGTQEIVASCLSSKMQEPEFFEQAGAFVVRMWSRHYKAIVKQRVNNLTPRQQAILDVLGDRKISPKEIKMGLLLDVSDRTLRRELNLLQDQGYIDSEGPPGWDRLWFVLKIKG